MYHLLYLLVCLNIGLFAAPEVVGQSTGLALTIGTLGVWRYSWALINFIRAKIYLHIVF